MNSFNLKKVSLAVLATVLMFGAVNAQARYKNRQRVRIDADKPVAVKHNDKKSDVTTTSAAYVDVTPKNETVATAPEVVVNETSTASVSNETVVVKNKTKAVTKNNVVKNMVKANTEAFTKQVKDNSKIMDVKDVKKSAMETWLLLMIILYAAGVVLIILGVVFAFTVIGVLGLIFYILGALCLVAASIILILGLTGVM